MCRVIPRISYACFMAKIYFIDTGNMNCMIYDHAIHVPSINEIYLGSGPCIFNAGDRTDVYIYILCIINWNIITPY
jgi:hypothetical protein